VALEAVIFDLDGVLVDTAELHFRAWKRLADELGVPFDRAANEALRGVDRRESYLRLRGRRDIAEAEIGRHTDRKNVYYRELLEALSPAAVLAGAAGLLAALRAAGVRVAAASSSRNARRVLSRTHLADALDAVVDGNELTAAKPDPQIFLRAARKLGVSPAACVVVEDAADGVAAALAAGMAAVGIGPPRRVGAAAICVDGVHELNVEILRRAADRAF
jgi:beta-phosphoglucomutase